jgi:hypothetical protein
VIVDQALKASTGDQRSAEEVEPDALSGADQVAQSAHRILFPGVLSKRYHEQS